MDWDDSLGILLMGFLYFLNCLFHCFDWLWSRCGSRGRSWDRSYNHSYINWLLCFLYRF